MVRTPKGAIRLGDRHFRWAYGTEAEYVESWQHWRVYADEGTELARFRDLRDAADWAARHDAARGRVIEGGGA